MGERTPSGVLPILDGELYRLDCWETQSDEPRISFPHQKRTIRRVVKMYYSEPFASKVDAYEEVDEVGGFQMQRSRYRRWLSYEKTADVQFLARLNSYLLRNVVQCTTAPPGRA